jgi:hypothetical protein
VTIENRQVSEVVRAEKATTYWRGAARTGAVAEAARTRRAKLEMRIVIADNYVVKW